MMARNNLTGGEVQIESHKELLSSPSLAVGLQRQSIYLAVVNVILSLTAILGNFLILVTLRKQFSLHPPSKLLYRCLATTDLLVDLISQPLYAIYWISIANEHWNLCRYTRDAASITGYSLCGVSLGTNDVDDGHNCWRTSRLVVGDEIQTNYHFEAHKYYFSCQLGFIWCCCIMLHFRLPHNPMCVSVIHLVYWSQWSRSQRYLAPSFIIRHKYKFMFNYSRVNQIHWTFRDTVSISCLLCTAYHSCNRVCESQ